MKKILSAFMALIMIFTLASCGDNTPEIDETSSSETETQAPVQGENDFYTYDEYENYIVLTSYKKNDAAVTLPTTINSKPVTSFGDIFYGNITLAYVVVPGSYTSVDSQAFYNCINLTAVTLSSEKLTSIGDKAFFGCQNLRTARITSPLTEIHEDAFKYCTDLIIYGESGSAVEEFCNQYSSIYFRSIGSSPEEETAAVDQSMAQQEDTQPSSEPLTDEETTEETTEEKTTEKETTEKKTTKKETTTEKTTAVQTTAEPQEDNNPLGFLDLLQNRD